MIFVIEFLVILIIMVIAAWIGYRYTNKKQKTLSVFLLAVLGVILICIKNVALWVPIYMYMPKLFGMYMDILQALGAVLVGVSYPLMKEKARQRILFGVFVLIFVFYMSFDKLYLVFQNSDYTRLTGKERDGVILQSRGYTCFPASVATALKYWNLKVTEKDAAYLARTTPRGTDSYRMIYAIEQLGKEKNLSARLKTISLQQLDNLKQPCILTVYISTSAREIPHAVVFLGKQQHEYIIGDPLHGRLAITRDILLKSYSWAGDILYIEQK